MTTTATLLRRAALTLMAAGSLFAGAAPAQAGNRDFILLNQLETPLISVRVRPSGTTGWGDDLLGRYVLRTGANLEVRMGEGSQCLYDIKLVLPTAEPRFDRINLCRETLLGVVFDGQYKLLMR